MRNLSRLANWLYAAIIGGLAFLLGILKDEIAVFLRNSYHKISLFETFIVASLIALTLISLLEFFFILKLWKEKIDLISKNLDLIEKINTDNRSGLHSYEFLKSEYINKYEKKIRSGKNFCALMIDIVDFKEINDKNGHDGGDHVISYVGGFIKSFVRGRDDLAARFGEAADEFFFIIEGDRGALGGFTNRLRRELDEEHVQTRSGPVKVALWSSGTVILQADKWDDVRERLSEGLVRAKSSKARDLVFVDPA